MLYQLSYSGMGRIIHEFARISRFFMRLILAWKLCMMPGMDLKEYYSRQSGRAVASAGFAAEFGDSPDRIMARVRRILFHPCELPENFSAENWPAWPLVADLEKEIGRHKIVAGICRHFTMLCVAVMRAKNIPARSRCGFATYFTKGGFEDHWVVEYWDGGWVMADAQTKRPCIPTGDFINGALAWQSVRKLGFAPDLFGFSGQKDEQRGLYYVAGNLIRDASGLLKHELEYDEECEMIKEKHTLKDSEIAMLDNAAEMVLNNDVQGLEKLLSALYPKLLTD